MTSIEPIEFNGQQIVPLQFLKAVLPDPASLCPRTVGKTNIGCIFQGVKDGRKRLTTFIMYATIKVLQRVGSQAISTLQACLRNDWGDACDERHLSKPAYGMLKNLTPTFTEALNKWGLPWNEDFNPASWWTDGKKFIFGGKHPAM